MEKGIVYKSTGSWYKVITEEGTLIDCRIRGKFRLKGLKTTNPVAVGDNVEIEISESDNTGVITSITERKNYIIRKASNLSKQYHIIAANLDRALLLISMSSPVTPLAFIDRFLVTAEAYQIPVIIAFNKIDIYTDDELDKMLYLKDVYEQIGYKCIDVSAKNNFNVDKIKGILTNKTTLLSGNSGVGKSTLINRIDPNLDLKTAEVSDYHKKGKHTTTFAEMFDLTEGGKVIDTPGIKGFGIIDIDREELFHFFPEIFKEAKNCQFHNCVHTREPKCAVKEAVESGKISELRYENYLSLYFDEDNKHRL